MKIDDNLIITVRILFCLMFIGLILGTMIHYGNVEKTKSECKRLSSYNYDARVEGSFFGSEDIQCFIYMEDGTKVNSIDFNVADYKKPRNLR